MTTEQNNALTLVLGGTGKTGKRIAARLEQSGHRVRAVARSTTPAFDWHDARTWDNALDGATAVYINFAPDLAVPGAPDAIQAFVNRAVATGVTRIANIPDYRN